MEKLSDSSSPHVLFFPFPAQGHVNPILKLAELLCLSNFTVTFVNSEHNHQRLVNFTDIQQRCSKYPGTLLLRPIPDGLPEDHPRRRFLRSFEFMESAMRPAFKEMLIQASPPVNCVIGDGFLGFVFDVAREIGLPAFCFRIGSAGNFWCQLNLSGLIQAGELPIKEEEDLDRLIEKVPGMESYLRYRDLPFLCRIKEEFPVLLTIQKQIEKSLTADALIMDTFEDLEEPFISRIRTKFPKFYNPGPLHLHLKTSLKEKSLESNKSSSSLWQENRDCIKWLDGQPPRSVLYVNFGSITVMTVNQLLEFWHGLLNSKQRFLLVVRPGFVTDSDGENLPEGLVRGTAEKEYMVIAGWVPQEEVLAHEAVGGFLTHCGWNSVLESIVEGVPMICWPYFAEQTLNSRLVSEVWKLGLDMKDVCDRKVVEKMVNDLMVERREEFTKSAARLSEMAKTSASPGGSSYSNLKRLIEDIRMMSMEKRGT